MNVRFKHPTLPQPPPYLSSLFSSNITTSTTLTPFWDPESPSPGPVSHPSPTLACLSLSLHHMARHCRHYHTLSYTVSFLVFVLLSGTQSTQSQSWWRPTLLLYTCTHEAECGLGKKKKNTSKYNRSFLKIMTPHLKWALHTGQLYFPTPSILPSVDPSLTCIWAICSLSSPVTLDVLAWVPSSQPWGFYHLPSEQAPLFP